MDMNDVEGAARRLLGDAELSGWMQQRLDARVRHLLIDEFQDTNPLQWQALYGWLSGYAGAGSGEAPAVFLVGDPKQSIYRFRRAEPQVFKAAQAFVVDGLSGALLSCDHTRRCATGVIEALNAVMTGAAQDAGYTGFREHTTESHEAGAVLALPPVPRDAGDDGKSGEDEPVWRDSLNTPRVEPEDSLSAREAEQAADWIAAQIASGAVRAEDLMVLSRKRERLAWLHEALRRTRHRQPNSPKSWTWPNAPAVQDVVALLDALVSPAHDLSLARALKSPHGGLERRGAGSHRPPVPAAPDAARAAAVQWVKQRPRTAWWELLQALSADGSDDAADRCPAGAGWHDSAGALALYERLGATACRRTTPLAAIYRDGDVLARFAAAVPPRQREPVLASLRALLAHRRWRRTAGRYLTPTASCARSRPAASACHRPRRPGAVRLLTIHGAKGLEAHTVLLLDTDSPTAQAPRAWACWWTGPAKPSDPGASSSWPAKKRRRSVPPIC